MDTSGADAPQSRPPRRFSHWTPRYIFNRTCQWLWEQRNPELPWLTRGAVEFLDEYVRPGDIVAEFGAGRSPVWFAHKVGPGGRVVSVEHNRDWYVQVCSRLQLAGIEHALVALAPNDAAAYVGAVSQHVPGRSADLILIDGVHRDACAIWSLGAINAGGLAVIDNVQRYLSHHSHCPHAMPYDGQPASALWGQFLAAVLGWRRRWITDGVNDTAVDTSCLGGRRGGRPVQQHRSCTCVCGSA